MVGGAAGGQIGQNIQTVTQTAGNVTENLQQQNFGGALGAGMYGASQLINQNQPVQSQSQNVA